MRKGTRSSKGSHATHEAGKKSVGKKPSKLSKRSIEFAEKVLASPAEVQICVWGLLHVFTISRERGKELDVRAARQWYKSLSPQFQVCAREAFSGSKWANVLV